MPALVASYPDPHEHIHRAQVTAAGESNRWRRHDGDTTVATRRAAKADEIGTMSAPPPASSETSGSGDEGERGPEVLGRLPRSRPAVRSPRRAERYPGPRRDAAGGEGEATAEPGREAEIEALARAGVALAGEAASLGLRVAGRAAAALRSAVERR
jgi:hypothetical protein